jgi:hypothetical protein
MCGRPKQRQRSCWRGNLETGSVVPAFGDRAFARASEGRHNELSLSLTVSLHDGKYFFVVRRIARCLRRSMCLESHRVRPQCLESLSLVTA